MGPRVLVVDDRQMPRFAARAMLAEASEVRWAGEAASGVEAVAAARSLRPEVVLMDVEMPGLSGAEATRLLLHETPSLRVLAWTVSDAGDDLLAMISAGCVGYVLKDVGPQELERAIMAAVRDDMPLPRRMIPELVKRASLQPRLRPLAQGPRLTDRETQVLRLLAKGEAIKQIAAQLGISVTSVNTHVRGIYGKLGASARGEAIALALRSGVISLSEV